MNKSASEKAGPVFEREVRKGGISGMYYDRKVGKRNQTNLAGWQMEGEPSTFKSSGSNDKLLALRQDELSGVIFSLLCRISGKHAGVSEL